MPDKLGDKVRVQHVLDLGSCKNRITNFENNNGENY